MVSIRQTFQNKQIVAITQILNFSALQSLKKANPITLIFLSKKDILKLKHI